jgi:hypothetical protein
MDKRNGAWPRARRRRCQRARRRRVWDNLVFAHFRGRPAPAGTCQFWIVDPERCAWNARVKAWGLGVQTGDLQSVIAWPCIGRRLTHDPFRDDASLAACP